jgi:two-component system, LytTR family, response regulator LytT
MRVVIVEDELPAVRALEKVLRDTEPDVDIVKICDSVSTAVTWFKDNPPPDLVFMDIQLGDGISFEIFEKADIQCPVIFVTAYDEYAFRAFKLNSIDYLLKPVNTAELAHSLHKFKAIHTAGETQQSTVDIHRILKSIQLQHPTYKSRFLILFRDQYISIPVEEISYFFSEHKNTYLVARDQKKHVIDYTIEKLEEELDPRVFFRVNRQYLVSYPAIAAVHSFFNGKLKIFLRGFIEEIIISRERAASFKEWLDR